MNLFIFRIETTDKIFSDQYFSPSEFSKSQDGLINALDIGCGIGGGCDYLSKIFPGSSVLGLDLAKNCIDIAQERYTKNNSNVSFKVADAIEFSKELPVESFNLIYSRDALLHIASKDLLFSRLLNITKVGGKFLFTDYCAAPRDTWSSEFETYVAERGYTLHTVEEYKKILEKAGWLVERAEDTTDWFIEVLKDEISKMTSTSRREEFLSKFSEKELDDLLKGWEEKVVRSSKGEQRWGLFIATKADSGLLDSRKAA